MHSASLEYKPPVRLPKHCSRELQQCKIFVFTHKTLISIGLAFVERPLSCVITTVSDKTEVAG